MAFLDDLVDWWALASHADVHVTMLCAMSACVLLSVVITLYIMRRQRPVYLLNYSVYKPPDNWKITHDEFIQNSINCGVWHLTIPRCLSSCHNIRLLEGLSGVHADERFQSDSRQSLRVLWCNLAGIQ